MYRVDPSYKEVWCSISISVSDGQLYHNSDGIYTTKRRLSYYAAVNEL